MSDREKIIGGVDPEIGGTATVDISDWPAGETRVWLLTEDYRWEQDTYLVLSPAEARELAYILMEAADEASDYHASKPNLLQ